MTDTTKFRGFHGITDKGTPCYILNTGELKDGTPAYKVRLGVFTGYAGWSGGARREASYTGKTGFIAKTKVKRRRG